MNALGEPGCDHNGNSFFHSFLTLFAGKMKESIKEIALEKAHTKSTPPPTWNASVNCAIQKRSFSSRKKKSGKSGGKADFRLHSERASFKGKHPAVAVAEFPSKIKA